jgi:hypothetical protein
MKIRIAKKKLKKVISEAYRINKKHIKLTRTYFVLNSDYGYRYCDGSIGLYFIKIQKKKNKEETNDYNQETFASAHERNVRG